MKTKTALLCLAVAASFSACATPEPVYPDTLSKPAPQLVANP